MTMDTNNAKIWLHWCEILPKKQQQQFDADRDERSQEEELYETYHMNRLYAALLDEEDMVKELRRKANNIIDWGCIQRMIEIKDVMTMIFMAEQAAAQEELEIAKEHESPRKKLKRKKP